MRGGREVVSFALGHGDDPLSGLRARGWSGRRVRVEGALGDLVLRYEVVAVTPRRPLAAPVSDLTAAELAGVVPRQRVAAYAVVVDAGRLLLTQLAPRTGAEGRWTLPGGGLDPGEVPADAVVREVLEETGQHVDAVRFVDVMTQHWVGRSDRGVEDYHAVRLVHTARCARPTRPVVHDVGGSTSDARWVALDRLGDLEVVPTVPWALAATGVVAANARGGAGQS
ncbi:MAG: NUDIX domain-containing protein [Micrococcales bacterium]|nr:NUDIX domain-containing protein [Micrococcales bacterium]